MEKLVVTTTDEWDLFDNPENFTGSDSPESLNSAITAALKEDFPEAIEASDTYVNLPGGIMIDGDLIRSAEVKELTGEDEEEIARAVKNGNANRFVEVLTRQALIRLGDEKPDKKLIKQLLTGDRDTILLQVARVTFGEVHEFTDIICPGCQKSLDIEFELKEIPIREKENATGVFEVKLRKGVAEVKFPVVGDYEIASENTSLTVKERDTVLLSRIVKTINGVAVLNKKEPVLKLGVKDRKAILDYVSENMPGPRYDKVEITHDECGAEVPLPIGVFDLFQELVS